MNEKIDPRLLHPENRFFLDYIERKQSALEFFEHPPDALAEAAEARLAVSFPREELADRLRAYNERLGSAAAVRANIDALATPDSLCVIGGQQVGFLGGPLFTVYKALSVLRAAETLAERLQRRVVPIFWLASEDHDFTEINRVRFLAESGDLRTVLFDWSDRGRPIERLPITEEIRAATDEALAFFPEARGSDRDVFLPEPSDDYAMWHARIWARLFADKGLVLVEPRTVRSMAGDFFPRALASADRIRADLTASAEALRRADYPAPIDPSVAGGLFTFGADGRRVRVTDPSEHEAHSRTNPDAYSPDALLRPILVDSLFPTIASILGASEIAYQAMIRPLYRSFGIPQPILLPRYGYTLVAPHHAALLERCGLTVTDVLSETFDPEAAVHPFVSPDLLEAFALRRSAVRTALEPLLEPLVALDPGLQARWKQTDDRIQQQIDGLEERAIRADLARSGISLRELRRLKTEIRPTGKPQERVLSLVHVAARHGLRWIDRLESSADPSEYAHNVVTLGDTDE